MPLLTNDTPLCPRIAVRPAGLPRDAAHAPTAASDATTVGQLGDRDRLRSSRWWWPTAAIVAVVVILGVAGTSTALAEPVLTPVHGSPFAINEGYDSVAFSPSGDLLAAANSDGRLSVFAVSARGVLHVASSSPVDGANSVAFSPSGALLAASGSGGISVFSVGAGGMLKAVPGSPFSDTFEPTYNSVAFSPSGALLVAGNEYDNAQPEGLSMFSVGPGGMLTPVAGSQFEANDDGYSSVAFSPSGALLAATTSFVPSVTVLSVSPSGALTPVTGSPFDVRHGDGEDDSVAFSPSGALLAVAGVDSVSGVSLFSVGPGGVLGESPGSPFDNKNSVGAVAFSPSGALLAAGNDDEEGGVATFAVRPTGRVRTVPGSPFGTVVDGNGVASFDSVAFSPSGALLAGAAGGAGDGGVFVFSVHASGAASGSSPTSGGRGSVPVARSAPRISGHAGAGGTLSCASGRWSRTPSRVTYRWVAQGRPIPGAATKLIRVRTVEEGTRIACITTPYSGSTAGKPVTSRSVYVAVPVVSGCPAASRALASLERLLGLRRSAVGTRLIDSSDSGQLLEDDFCLTPAGVLVGYPPASLLGALPGGERARFAGRVVWISTANRYYSVAGVGAGSTLAAAKQLLKLQGPYHVGGETWYLATHGRYLVVLIIRGGVVEQLGVSDWPGATTRAGTGRLLSGLREIARESTQISGPIRALDDYWFAIGEHAFLRATGYVRPGVLGSIAGFVSSERAEGVHSAQFEGQLLSETGSRARVRIVNLVTHDRQFGCRTWQGTYTLARSPLGRWQIARAAITPRSCT